MRRNNSLEKFIKDYFNKMSVNIGDIYYYDVVPSTMDISFNLDENHLTDRTLIIADRQTMGRGRYNRKWYGGKDDLMFSLVLLNYDMELPYSMITSYAIYKFIKKYTDNVILKWINDIYISGKKVAGILTEEKNNRTVIGVGINLNTENFPDQISEIATSMFIETGEKFDKRKFLVEVVESIIKYIERADSGGVESILKAWEKASKMKGVNVRVEEANCEYYGTVVGINYKTGALILKEGNRVKEIYDGTLYFY